MDRYVPQSQEPHLKILPLLVFHIGFHIFEFCSAVAAILSTISRLCIAKTNIIFKEITMSQVHGQQLIYFELSELESSKNA